MILDNYAAHKHRKVHQWLERHHRWTVHFTPASALRLNAVEGFFAIPAKRRRKRGILRSIIDFQTANNQFLAENNQQSKPLRGWRQV